MSQAGYVVVDVWRAKPGMVTEVDALLASIAARFRAAEGVVSVDYARLEDSEDQYLVIFRYADKAARERFVETGDLKSTMSALRQIWDLESPIYRGTALT
jgi:quinol monooxygenase YgiN